ncbi:MAG TPA: YciI family protein [Nitrospiria bacterium]|nr:YciI family protein [Nitrospiria bacterium]
MAKFVIIGLDGPEGQARRKIHREAHIERLSNLAKEGKIILAGPFTDGSGSLIVVEAASLEEAEALAEEDPYMTGKVFQKVEVKPFMQVFPS